MILVIDDDPVMRELLSLHLSNAGYQVQVAEDAIVGGYITLNSRPELVIADVEMPHLNGYELVAAMKADPFTRDIPVIFLTTRDDVDDHARQLGAQAYLRKPVKADKLLELVALFNPLDLEAQPQLTRTFDK